MRKATGYRTGLPKNTEHDSARSITIVIGTKNRHKVREVLTIYRLYKKTNTHRSLKFISLSRFKNAGEVKESGKTYQANAIKKAKAWAKETGFITLAEDSGLEVRALKGRPGIYSARYALSDLGKSRRSDINSANNQKVLKQLNGARNKDARYRCFAVLASPEGKVIFKSQGICTGKIALKPAGERGFGYDPIFIPSEENRREKTFGQLPASLKHRISHRARRQANRV